MFFNRKKVEYQRNNGKVVGALIGGRKFRIERYELMANKPSFYLYDSIGTKIANTDSFEELDRVIRCNA